MQQIVEATLHTTPKAATHWSTRTLAAVQGVSASTVQRIWDAHGLQPHRTRTFKLSRDPHFVEKLTDVVGLYLNPPDKALVLAVDEKSQIQALDRTQPGLPLKKGRCGTFTHDYKRNGTMTLFAALNVLTGTVIGECLARHRHQEFIRFLRTLDRETPPELTLHLIVAQLRHPQTSCARSRRGWPGIGGFICTLRRPASSWLNLVERWLGKLPPSESDEDPLRVSRI